MSPAEPGVLLVAEQLRRPVPGGIGTYVRGLLSGLAALEAEGRPVPPVTLFASRPPPGPDPVAALGPPLRSSALPGPLLVRAWDRGLAGPPALAPLVHAPSLAVPPARPGVPLVVAVHDLAWRRVPGATTARGRRWHEAALGRALRRGTAFVVPSEPVAADLAAAGAPPDRIRLVPEGADHLAPPDGAGAAELLARLGVDGPFLLTVSTLEPRKNLGRLLTAHDRALARLPGPWPLLVVGPRGWGGADGSGAPGPDEARPLVRFTGPVSDGVLAALYTRAALFCYVPLAEGYGLPPLEAMSAGVPVVASSAVPSVVPDPGGAPCALVVDPGDEVALAGALVEGAGDADRRAALVAAGRERARVRTWRAAAEGHLALWAEVGGWTP